MKQGVLLRSGRADAFMALGEGGRPVFRSALQLREALRRRAGNFADHLAIPQSNETGSTLDWYSPVSGQVVPWTAATEQEREEGLKQLSAFQARLNEMTPSMDAEEQEALGDKALFSSLLRRVLYFPDDNFVYLVNGKPVLTFWGFLHHGADQNQDPLLPLMPAPKAAPVVAPPVVPPVEPVVAPVVAPVAASWWSRWWWRLSALLLLLALLLFGLRWCTTPVVPDTPLGAFTSSVGSYLPEKVRNWLGWSLPKLDAGALLPNGRVDATALVPTGTVPLVPGATGAGTAPGVDAPGAAAPGADAPAAPGAPDAGQAPDTTPPAPPAEPGTDANPQPPELPQDPASPPADPAAPPTPDANPATPATPAAPAGSLVVPPDALQTGKMDFLNGQWAARMGVQDSQTGKPVQLQYQLKDGAGNVQIKRGDGVQCEAPVSASSEQGRLILNANSAAKCTDNAAYDMPKIVCDPGAAGAAAQCAGMYGSNAFPLILQQSE